MSKSRASEVAILEMPDVRLELPIRHSVIGPDVIDISNLHNAGYFTFDPGFKSTASCSSSLTFINGKKGLLLHRGYCIDDIAKKSDFMELCYLLLNGELPSKNAKTSFINDINKHCKIEPQLMKIFDAFPRSAHPMSMLISAVSGLSAFYHNDLDITDPKQRQICALQLIAKVPVLTAMIYRYSKGLPLIGYRDDLNFASNFLYMMFCKDNEEYKIDPILSNAIDKLFILHADHEQNASTSTVRLAGSSGANPFAVISAGISSLWGAAHGGANEAVIKMLEKISDPKNIPIFIKKAKDKNDPFRMMGFGHRVYKNYDPRASILKQTCSEVMKKMKIKSDPLLEIALRLEDIALKDSYFIEKKLYPNVDFYSGIIYRALGIETQMFTAIFAAARTAGWVAQWKEMMEDPEQKIGRPRQHYNGPKQRPFPTKD